VGGTVESLGKNLRALRKEEGLTLQQLGERVGLSASYLSQVERGVTLPSLSRLTSIAEALGVEVRVFFEDDATSPCVVRAHEGKKLRCGPGISVELLSAHPFGKNIQPHCLVLRPGAGREDSSVYPSEECGFVLRGELTVTVGEETFVLAAGDSIHYHRHQPHSWRNNGDQECVVLWTVSPPLAEESLRGGSAQGKEVVA
jgi:transcriptional regulator with XRE-family HTH domain